MTSQPVSVRPTKRCLGDLTVGVPDLGVSLSAIPHSVVVSAQALPEQRDAGGVERVASLADRVWFKIKKSGHRAVATELRPAEVPDGLALSVGAWWIGAAGHRQNDSPQHDFYAALRRECGTARSVSTDHLMPREWDWKRLRAEQAVAWRSEMRRMVVDLIAMSLTTGRLAVAEFRSHRVMALVVAADGHEAYLAIVAEGIPDPQVIALLLDCVPGVDRDDWQPEPSPVAGLNPGPGEVVWSTLFPREVASLVLDLAGA